MAGKPVGSFYVQLGLNTKTFQKNLAAAQRDLREAFGTAAIHASEVLAASIGAIGTALGVLAVKATKMSMEMEKQQIALAKMLGSNEAAIKRIKELQEFSMQTGIDYSELVDYQKKLMAVGFSAEETDYMLHQVADSIAIIGNDAGKIDRLIKAFGDVKAKGTLQTQEIKQFAELGINAWDMLAVSMGKTRAELVKMVEAREISAAQALNAITGEIRTRWGGMSEDMAKTASGAFNKVKVAFQIAMAELGSFIKTNMPLVEFFEKLAAVILNVTNILKTKGFKQVLSEISEKFQLLIQATEVLAASFAAMLIPGLASVASYLLLMTAPLATIALLVGSLSVLVLDVTNALAGTDNIIGNLLIIFDRKYRSFLIGLVKGFNEFILNITKALQSINTNIVGPVKDAIAKTVDNLFSSILYGLKHLIYSSTHLIGSALDSVIQKMLDGINPATDKMADLLLGTPLRKLKSLSEASLKTLQANKPEYNQFTYAQDMVNGVTGFDNELFNGAIVMETAQIKVLEGLQKHLKNDEDEAYKALIRTGTNFIRRVEAETDNAKTLYETLTTQPKSVKKAMDLLFEEMNNGGEGGTGTGTGTKSASPSKNFFNTLDPAQTNDGMPVDELLPLISSDANSLLNGAMGMSGLPGMGANMVEELFKISGAFDDVAKKTQNAQKTWGEYKQEIALTAVDTFNQVLWASGNFFENLGEGLKSLGQQIMQQITQFLLLRAIFGAFNLGSFDSYFPYAKLFSGKSDSMDDGVVQNGKLITTHPDDYIIATKDPSSLGGSANVVVNVTNNTQSQISTNSYFDGTREIIDIVIDGLNRNVSGIRDTVRAL